MAKVLLDHNCPRPLARLLTGHTARTAAEEGWPDLTNGDLLDAAEKAGFEVMVTGDKNIRYQQNLAQRRIALVVLSDPSWPVVRGNVPPIVDAVNLAVPGSYTEVTLPRPVLRRRPPPGPTRNGP